MTEQHGADHPETPDESREPAGGGQPPAPKGSSTGLESNLAGLLAYILGPITGIIFLVVEKEDRFVRFHAAQSVTVGVAFIVLGIGLSILSAILQIVPVVGPIIGVLLFFLSLLIWFGGFILWVVLLIQAFSGKEWEVPYLGEQARKVVLKENTAGSG